MQQYAIDEVHGLLSRVTLPVNDINPVFRYVCALFAELAYYHIPAYEIDDKKRAKVIPCEAYQAIIKQGNSTDVLNLIRKSEFEKGFVVVDRGVVAVGVVINRLLFIGFRGTQFLFDWRINLRAKLVHFQSSFFFRPPFLINPFNGRIHRGFYEETLRIALKVLDAIRDSNLGDIEHLFLTGHSLGGAVAAIAEHFIKIAPTSVCIFGSPRYCDASAYSMLPARPPTQIRRPGDMVPTIPPRWLGYIDHPYEFTTAGHPYVEPASQQSLLSDLRHWELFLEKRFVPHNVENYRKELGLSANAQYALALLAPFERLTSNDAGSR